MASDQPQCVSLSLRWSSFLRWMPPLTAVPRAVLSGAGTTDHPSGAPLVPRSRRRTCRARRANHFHCADLYILSPTRLPPWCLHVGPKLVGLGIRAERVKRRVFENGARGSRSSGRRSGHPFRVRGLVFCPEKPALHRLAASWRGLVPPIAYPHLGPRLPPIPFSDRNSQSVHYCVSGVRMRISSCVVGRLTGLRRSWTTSASGQMYSRRFEALLASDGYAPYRALSRDLFWRCRSCGALSPSC